MFFWTQILIHLGKRKDIPIDVVSVTPKDDFVLLLKFENQEEREFDCKPLLDRKVYQPLNDLEFFNQAKVKYGTVVWNEQIDIAPESLYLESRKVN